MIKKYFALLAICLFCIAIFTSACGSGKNTPPDYPFFPLPTPTPTVSPTPQPTPTPEKFPLQLSQTEFNLNVGATGNVIVTLNGEDITQTATYTVDQEAIATVEQGLITGLSAGLATVTVHAENAEEDKTFTVNVIDPSLPTLELSQTQFDLIIGEEATVTVKLNGKDVTEKENTTYTSDEKSIATAEKGLIKAKYNGGTANITVSHEGANSATFTVKVTDDSDEEVTLDDDVLQKLGYHKEINSWIQYIYLKKNGVLTKNKARIFEYIIKQGEEEVTSLVIPATFNYESKKYKITKIGKKAFTFCNISNGLTVIIPESVTEIEDGEDGLLGVPDGSYTQPYIENPPDEEINGQEVFEEFFSTNAYGAFSGASVSIEIPNSVTKIGSFAFTYSGARLRLDIPNSVTTIGKNAFYQVSHIYYTDREELKNQEGYPNWGANEVN